MTKTYYNQGIGAHGGNGVEGDYEYVAVSHDERAVGFSFHHVGTRDPKNRYIGVHGITVDARHVFNACKAFSNSPDKVVWSDGGSSWVTRVYIEAHGGKPEAQEFRLGDRFGKCVARMERTGYIQSPELKARKEADALANKVAA